MRAGTARGTRGVWGVLLGLALAAGCTRGAEEEGHWARAVGGPGEEWVASVAAVPGGGFLAAGSTPLEGSGSAAFWALRLDAAGGLLWQRAVGGRLPSHGSAAVADADGGGLVTGYSHGFGSGARDGWAVRLDPEGNVVWQRAYGGTDGDWFAAAAPAPGGGYLAAGGIGSWRRGRDDLWLVRLDPEGNVVWQRAYGGDGFEGAFGLCAAPEGGWFAAGVTRGLGAAKFDAWVLRLDAEGTPLWQQAIGGVGDDWAHALAPTGDGGVVLAGETGSSGHGGQDAWLVRLSASGDVLWQKAYGGVYDDRFGAVEPDGRGGFAVAGMTNSFGEGGPQAWAVSVDGAGEVRWQRTQGPSGRPIHAANAVAALPDGSLLFGGKTELGGALRGDGLLVRSGPDGRAGQLGAETAATAQPSEAVVTRTGVTVQETEAATVDTDARVVAPPFAARDLLSPP